MKNTKTPKRNEEVFKFMATIGRGVQKAVNATITDGGYLMKRKGYNTFGEMVDVLWKINKQNRKMNFTSEYTIVLPLKGTKPIYKKTLQPMGVSQWRSLGEKYGYWDYFEKETRQQMVSKLEPYIEHLTDYPDRCVFADYQAGRPTASGGYEMKFGDKWYESKPVDKTPKCTCGLDDILISLKRENK